MGNKRHISEDEEEEEEEIYEVERLVDHRITKQRGGKKVMYLIKWKNYDDDSNTWENEENIYSKDVINEYWERIGKPREESTKAKTLKRKRQTTQKKGDTSITTPNTRTRTRTTGDDTTSSSSSSSSDEDAPDASKESPMLSRELSVKPPGELQWEDATKVNQIYADIAGNLVAKVTWSNGTESYIQTSLLRNVRPAILFQFYESHLKYGPIEEEK